MSDATRHTGELRKLCLGLSDHVGIACRIVSAPTGWHTLYGLCLALRADHGQFARVATNYDGLIISVLVEAQSPEAARAAGRRTAGPCPLRGMRTAPVARGEGARLAAAVSLVLASAEVRDHIADGDGALGRRPVAAAARRVATCWDRAGALTGSDLGFDTAVLVAAVDRQPDIEALAGRGTPLLTITEPTETATAAAFAHTAELAGRPANRAPLAEVGRLFGRLAHLLDAVEDLDEDARTGAWNPLLATGATLAEARRLCEDAVHGVRLALRDVEFTDGKLAHVLLAHELRHAVHRAFGPTCSHPAGHPASPYGPGTQQPYGNPYAQPQGGQPGHGDGAYRPYAGLNAPQGAHGAPQPLHPGPGHGGSGGDLFGDGGGDPGGSPCRPPRRRSLVPGCARMVPRPRTHRQTLPTGPRARGWPPIRRPAVPGESLVPARAGKPHPPQNRAPRSARMANQSAHKRCRNQLTRRRRRQPPSPGRQQLQRVDRAVREAPLVVVPGDHLHVATVHPGEGRVEDGRGGVARDVGGDQGGLPSTPGRRRGGLRPPCGRPPGCRRGTRRGRRSC